MSTVVEFDATVLASLYQDDNSNPTPVESNNDPVGLWVDQANSNGYDAVQATGDNQPLYNSSTGINGQPSLVFCPAKDWHNHYLVTSSIFDSSYDTAFTIFSVADQYEGLDAYSYRMYYRVQASINTARVALADFFHFVQFDQTELSRQSFRFGAQKIYGSNIRVVGMSYDGSTLRLIVNGHLIKLSVTGNLGLSSALSIGYSPSGDYNWMGNIGAVRVFDTALNDAEMRSMHNTMAAIYGLTSSKALRPVVFCGDSQIAGAQPGIDYGVDDCISLIAAELGYENQSFFNRGIGGSQIAYMDDQEADEIAADTNLGSEKIVVLWAGTNDVADSAENYTPSEILDFMDSWCDGRRAVGYTKIVVATALPRSAAGDSVNRETRRQSFNSLLRSNYTNFADALADVAADSRIGDDGDEYDTDYYNTDYVHLNGGGHAVIAPIFQLALEGVLQRYSAPLPLFYRQ